MYRQSLAKGIESRAGLSISTAIIFTGQRDRRFDQPNAIFIELYWITTNQNFAVQRTGHHIAAKGTRATAEVHTHARTITAAIHHGNSEWLAVG